MWDAEGKYYPDNSGKPLLQEEKKGAKIAHDPQFRGFKTDGRKFQDVLFGLLFVVMFVGMAAVNVIGFKRGDPSKLLSTKEYNELSDHSTYWIEKSLYHLKRDYDVLITITVLALVLGIVWIQLMRMFTKLFIYLTLFLGVAVVVAAGALSLFMGMKHNSEGLRIGSYVTFAIGAILIVGILILRKKINLTAALFTECCQGVQHNPSLFIAGILVFVMMTAFFAYWFTGFIFLFSIPSDEKIDIPNKPQFNTTIRNLIYFNIFGFYWTVAFLSAVFQTVVAGGISSWYFTRNGESKVRFATFRTLGYAFTKSFGSLAFGSLVFAIVKFLNFLVSKAKASPANRNRVTQCVLSCIQCCLGCIEKLVKFINRFTYVHIAMHGDSFCASARNTFNLISRNGFTMVIVDALGDFVLFVGKLLGTAICAIAAFFMLEFMEREITAFTIVVVVVIAFLIMDLFSHIVGGGVDTVLICYLEDLERNEGKEYHIDSTLHTMLQDKASGIN